MDLRQLRVLTAVADHGTFSAAAAALHTVQSNVSAHIAHLEQELGVALVDRAAGKLTAEGDLAVARARRAAFEIDALVADLAALRDDVRGTVRLGVVGTTGRWLVPRLLVALAERHPGIHLVAVDGVSTTLEPQVMSGYLDMAVVTLPVPGDDLATDPLFEEDLVLVVPAGDPLATSGSVDIAAIDGMPLLLPLRGTAFRDEVEAAASANGVRLVAKAELDGLRLIASLTFDGHGPALLPATAVPTFLEASWRSVAVTGIPRRRVGVAVRRRGLPSAPARAVHALLGDVVHDAPEHAAGIHPFIANLGASTNPGGAAG